MTIENQQTSTPGFSRRTALKAAAWSVPVVAAATAVPAYAASGTVDVSVQGMPFGDGFGGMSPDRLRTYSLAVPGGVEVTNLGATDIAAGSLLAVSFDARLVGDATAALDSATGTPLTAAGTSTTGNITTASFLLPALPAGGTVSVYQTFGTWPAQDGDNWYEDVESYSVTATANGATDSDQSNNSMIIEPWYRDTVDAAISVAWGEESIPNVDDAANPYVVDVPRTVTIRSLAPGGVSNESNFTFSGPTVYAQGEGPAGSENWTEAFERATVTSATLDGVDILSELSDESNYNETFFANFWLRDTPIEPGQTVVFTLDVAVRTAPIGGLYPNGGVSVRGTMYPDRDESNNVAESPLYGS